MRWTWMEAARNEKQSNQPLSVSVIFSLLPFPSAAAFYFLPSASRLSDAQDDAEGGLTGRKRGRKEGLRLALLSCLESIAG